MSKGNAKSVYARIDELQHAMKLEGLKSSVNKTKNGVPKIVCGDCNIVYYHTTKSFRAFIGKTSRTFLSVKDLIKFIKNNKET